MSCKISYFQQNDIEPVMCSICRYSPEQHLRDNPGFVEKGGFMNEDEAILYLKKKFKAVFYCHEHSNYLCSQESCKLACGRENL